jgi:hypothetical protein|tara:strand:+ start:2689 stop:3399 length:711 start_codon:yes stop_codon:yes gene_type:complete
MSITISIKDKGKERDVVIPVEWKDITVKYWGELSSVIKKHYDAAAETQKESEDKTHQLLKEEFGELTDTTELNPSQTLQMNSDIFSYMTGLSKEDMKLVDTDQVSQVISTINSLTEEYKPLGKTSFDLDGETYYFPSEFFRKETYGDFIESTQLDMYIKDMKNGKYDILPEQMAILCRRIDEEYDEDIIPEKADKFRLLTMDIIWEFSFFLTHQSLKLTKLSHTYSQNNKQQQAQE